MILSSSPRNRFKDPGVLLRRPHKPRAIDVFVMTDISEKPRFAPLNATCAIRPPPADNATATAGNWTWIGDGSEGGKLSLSSFGATSCTVTCASTTQGTPYNARLDRKCDSYYEVKVTDLQPGGSLGVGLVTNDGFQPGWKTKGCFFNGNISNGSAGLIIGFGNKIKVGSVVGVRLMRIDGKCEIIFYLDGQCLGTGFSLDNNSDEFYPCIHVDGSTTVSFSNPAAPSVFERELSNHDNPYSGHWSIEQFFVGPELGEISASSKVNIQREGDGYRLVIKSFNSFSTSFIITGKAEAFDLIKFTVACISTKMMPPPEFVELEKVIVKALNDDGGFKKIIVSDSGRLILSGPTAEVICSRYVQTFEPVTSIN